jgi:hypothetical protein
MGQLRLQIGRTRVPNNKDDVHHGREMAGTDNPDGFRDNNMNPSADRIDI